MILTSVDSTEAAERIAAALLEARLAACVQVLPAQSRYRWRGRLECAAEQVLLIKTRAGLWDEVAAKIRALHPYEVPELARIAIEGGSADYLGWLEGETA